MEAVCQRNKRKLRQKNDGYSIAWSNIDKKGQKLQKAMSFRVQGVMFFKKKRVCTYIYTHCKQNCVFQIDLASKPFERQCCDMTQMKDLSKSFLDITNFP